MIPTLDDGSAADGCENGTLTQSNPSVSVKVNSDIENSLLKKEFVENQPDVVEGLAQNSSFDVMLKEEEALQVAGEKEEESLKDNTLKEWTASSTEQRYKKLNHLLEKSDVYAQYLLEILNKDKKKQEKRVARAAKKKSMKVTEEKENDKSNNKESSRLAAKRKQSDEDSKPSKKLKKTTDKRKGPKSKQTAIGSFVQKAKDDENEKKAKLEGAKFHSGDKVLIKTKGNDEEELLKCEIMKIWPLPNKEFKYEVRVVGASKTKTKLVQEKDIVHDICKEDDDDVDEEEVQRKMDIKQKAIVKVDKIDLLARKFYPGYPDAPNLMTKVGGVRYFKGQKVPRAQPELLTGACLRDYQITGFQWLKVLHTNSVNGILADEMGLGKTIQCISLVSHLISMKFKGPFLVCAPMSTICNWMIEFKRFTPRIPLLLFHGSEAERTHLRPLIGTLNEDLGCYPVVVTSFEILMRERPALSRHTWEYLILDEGHRIKNMKCRLVRELKAIPTNAKVLLTGTPLQNSLAELWSLLNYLLPEVFNDLSTFQAWFDLDKLQSDATIGQSSTEKEIIQTLHRILAPFLLRRIKSDVNIGLPAKREMIVFTPMTQTQTDMYKALTEKTIRKYLHIEKDNQELLETDNKVLAEKTRSKASSSFTKGYSYADEENHINVSLANTCMHLRKTCNHPYLINYPLEYGSHFYRIDEELITSSGKLSFLNRALPILQQKGHKVLLFSQMTKLLDIIEDYCRYRQYKFCRLDGSTKCEQRQMDIEHFNEDSKVFLYLLSTRAGGLGINLTAADTVIIYDSDWNPQNDLQAQDRCHRIGQTRPVMVYRLVAANTIDQFMVQRAEAKRVLEKAVIKKDKFKGTSPLA